MDDAGSTDAIRTAGAAIGEAIRVFMLHPETVEQGLAAGYPDPFAAYFAGRGGVLAMRLPRRSHRCSWSSIRGSCAPAGRGRRRA